MPFTITKRKIKKKYRKKNYKAKYSLTRLVGPGGSPSFPLGKSFKTTMRYVEVCDVLDPPGGGPASYIFSLNGLYDPNISYTGHQPLGFDQLMTMYNHYTVIGARVRVTLSNADATRSALFICQIKDSPTPSTAYSQLQTVVENGMVRYTICTPHQTGNSSKDITMNFSAKKFFGKSVITEHDFRGTATGNPTEQAYLHCIAAPVQPTVNNIECRLTACIEYITIFHEPKQLVTS